MGPANKNLEKLHDLNCVAYLTISGFPIIEVETEGDATVFCFEGNITLRRAILKYLNHQAKVDPLAFSEQLRNLRAVVRDKYSKLTEDKKDLLGNRSPKRGVRVWHNEEHLRGNR